MTVLDDHAPPASRRPSGGPPPEMDKATQAQLDSGVWIEETPYDFMQMASHKDVSDRVLHLLRLAIWGFSLLAILLSVVDVAAVWLRPQPQVLLSYPDGTLRCAPPSLNPSNGQPYARSASDQAACDTLAGGVTANEGGGLSQSDVNAADVSSAASTTPSAAGQPPATATTAGGHP